MRSEIYLLGVMKCGKEDRIFTRVEFAFADIQDTKNYKGVSVVSCFYDGHDVYNKLSKELLLKRVPAIFEFKDDLYNPLATKKILKKIADIELY